MRRMTIGFLLLAALATGLLARLSAASPTSPAGIAPARVSGDQVLSSWPDTERIVIAHLGRTVHLVSRACGFTMTIQRIYADAKQIIVGYTLTGPSGRTFSPGFGEGGVAPRVSMPTLVDAQGQRFPSIEQRWGTLHGNAQGRVMVFDASGLASHARTLALRLSVPAIQMNELNSRHAPAMPCERRTHANPLVRTDTFYGPFSFHVSASPMPIRAKVMRQSARAHGVTVTLRRVEMTPIATRIYLRVTGARPSPELLAELAVPTQLQRLSNPSSTSVHDGRMYYPGRGPYATRAQWRYDFVAPFYDYHGPATLIVFTHVSTEGDKGEGDDDPKASEPVTFHFTLP